MFRHHLFKSWIALSTGKITTQRMIVRETNLCYPVDSDLSSGSIIHLLNNWGQILIFSQLVTYSGNT